MPALVMAIMASVVTGLIAFYFNDQSVKFNREQVRAVRWRSLQLGTDALVTEILTARQIAVRSSCVSPRVRKTLDGVDLCISTSVLCSTPLPAGTAPPEDFACLDL